VNKNCPRCFINTCDVHQALGKLDDNTAYKS
jgi:hypothetical protein